MPLPKIATPTYELELPSTGKTIKFRPFLVKEEKLLVLALESNDTKEITNAIKAVLKDCIQTIYKEKYQYRLACLYSTVESRGRPCHAYSRQDQKHIATPSSWL